MSFEERLRQFDKRGDGKLTPDEFSRAGVFRQMDADRDGVVTLEEAKTCHGSGCRRPVNRED